MEDLLTAVLLIADNPAALFALLFFAAFFNTFFPVVPLEILSVFTGYLISKGHGSVPVALAAVTFGMFAGSVLFYHLAKFYGPSILKKPFFARLTSVDKLARARTWFEKYGAISLFAAKFVPGVYFCAVISSGLLSLKASRIYAAFLVSNLGAFAVLIYSGILAGEHWRQVYTVIGATGTVLLAAAIIAGAVLYFVSGRLRKNPR